MSRGRPDESRRLASGDMGYRTTDDEESALAPPIPSFASLRRGGRRSPADLLVSPQPSVDRSAPSSPGGAARPPEWADLWRLGLQVARWCAVQPCTTVRRLLG
jgi:hypothetical protein